MVFSRRRIQRRLRESVRTGFRMMLFLCVFVSFWQAPVPVVHRHCGNVGVTNARQMALHLKSLHADAKEREEGWHFHFVMLDDLVRGSGLPIPPQDGDSPILPKEHVVLGDYFQCEATSLTTPVLLAPLAGLSEVQPVGFNERTFSRLTFLEDLTTSCRLHLVLCIARC